MRLMLLVGVVTLVLVASCVRQEVNLGDYPTCVDSKGDIIFGVINCNVPKDDQ
jgi:hypothetical protein